MKFKSLQKKRRSGFTLVEMVIVVTILGILSGIGFMQFGNVQETSRKNADYVAAANLATASSLYISEYPNDVQFSKEEDVKNIEVSTLKNKGYINYEPTSQSERKRYNNFFIGNIKGIDEQFQLLCLYLGLDDIDKAVHQFRNITFLIIDLYFSAFYSAHIQDVIDKAE